MKERYIYVSFAAKDLPEVQKLIETLQALGFRVLFDQGTCAGADWEMRVKTDIENSNCLLVCLTKNSADSSLISQEVSYAISKGKEIVTVCLDEIDLPPAMRFQMSVGTMIRGGGDSEQLLEQLNGISSVKACRAEKSEEENDDRFQTAEIPKVSGCPEPPTAESGTYCPKCGQKLAKEARFCFCCGNAIGASCAASVPPPPMGRVHAPSMGKAMPSMSATATAPAADRSAPIRKKGFSERIKDFLSGNKMSDVNFSVLTPATFEKENYTMVDVYAYEEEFRHVVEQTKAERAKREGAVKESDGGHLQVKKGARITVRLSSPDLEITDNEESRVWTGKYAKFDFPVYVPNDYEKKQILFCADVYFDGVIATHIRFVASCAGNASQRPKLEQKDVHSAFISYASGDRERVALILQGMRRSRPDLDIFFDVETLKTGESWEHILRAEIDKRDVLYLCWSQLAKESEWVDMEWRYALKQKGLEGIEPIPLALPKDCPPPEELKGKHFGARELYYQ